MWESSRNETPELREDGEQAEMELWKAFWDTNI